MHRRTRTKKHQKGTWMKLTSADTLRALMAQRGLSIGELARWAGCSKGFISHLLAGRRRSCTEPLADSIAKALSVPTDILFVRHVSLTERQNVGRAA